MTLFKLTKKIFSRSAMVVVKVIIGSIVEALGNLSIVQGDVYDSLPKHAKASE